MPQAEFDHKSRSVCFTGHRNIPRAQYSEVASVIEEKVRILYRHGYERFYAGGARGFDMIASIAVLNLRRELPRLKLILALPCHDHDVAWDRVERRTMSNIKSAAAEVVYVSDEYYPGCMQRRNRYMVDLSSICIAYMLRPRGGTANTVSYAKKTGCHVLNVAPTINTRRDV